eukprot:SAG22_NODE_8071_length_686_cov_0.872232_2_plen_117_part_01
MLAVAFFLDLCLLRALVVAATLSHKSVPPPALSWNDGEQFNVHGDHIGNEMDPVMLEDYKASGITSRFGPDCFVPSGERHENATECLDWFSHVSAWRAGYATRWRDIFLAPTPTTKY